MPDTDPHSVDAPAPEPERDLEAAVVRANVMMRLLGEDEGPTKIGRFTLLERVAEGGMGVVFAAYDPELDRKVAVKLLRRDKTDDSVRKRMVREGQAMAKLSHPNVAQIYEVGAHDGGVFIAMEFVRGETLRAWQKQQGRDWREILTTYVQAGRGLAAAHAAGLVHRDFKPDNAIVGRDGRVRVLDFGLARAGEIETTSEIETQTVLPAPQDDAFGTPLTHAGSIMGTPAYMAPEQFLGEDVTAKADQFALCVSLWEGLFGERPFAGTSRADLIANVTRGRVREVPKQSRVPMWVRAVLLRGLAVGPSERFATTDALLAALENDPSRRRRRIMVAGASVATVAVVVASVAGYRSYVRAQKIGACEAAGASIEQVWNPQARTRVRDGLLATGVSYAPTTADKVMPWLDDQAQAWREHTTVACMNTTVHETWTADTLDRATWCLDERRHALAALVTELERADAQVVQVAVSAAASLAQASPCVDATVLANLPPPPMTEARASIATVRVDLARAESLGAAGKYKGALEVTRVAIERARALGWPPLLAAARAVEGELLDSSGAYAEAEAALFAAYVEAAKASAWGVANAAAVNLSFDVGVSQARHLEGRAWATHAEVMAIHAGDPLRLREAAVAGTLAGIEFATGEYGAATALLERTLAIKENALGSEHPEVAEPLANLASVFLGLGRYSDAISLFERVLAIDEKALGPEHPTVAATLVNLASAHRFVGAFAEAGALYERALVIYETALGPEHPEVAATLINVGGLHRMTGAHAQAKVALERALVIEEKNLGPHHPTLATGLVVLANVHRDAGAYADAKAMYARALAIEEKALGPSHHDIGFPLDGLAEIALAQSRPEDALPLAERAVRVREQGEVSAHLVADARFTLARALWEAPVSRGRDRGRANQIATAARDVYRATQGHERQADEVVAWLAAHAHEQ